MVSSAPASATAGRHSVAERLLENALFASRWLMAPFYLGLVVALVILLIKFVQELAVFAPQVFTLKESGVILGVLTLIDLSLAANLLIMVIFAGYENFVSKMEIDDDKDRPDWMGKVDFSAMKLKLIASIVAISGIHLLKSFMSIESADKSNLAWLVGIHMAFVVSGVLLAFMDFIAERAEAHHAALLAARNSKPSS